MKPEILFIGMLIAVIIAGPYKYAMMAGIGLTATMVAAMLTTTTPIDVFGMAVIGGIIFAGRGLLRALTGYGALVRFTPDDEGNGDDEAMHWRDRYDVDPGNDYNPDEQLHWRDRYDVDTDNPVDAGDQRHWREQFDVDAQDPK